MTDAPFVLAAYGLVAGSLAVYGFALRRRLDSVRRTQEAVAHKARAAVLEPSQSPARANDGIP